MNKTILSRKDLEILEAIIANYGYIASLLEIESLFSNLSYDELHRRLKFLVKRGWLIRIKQGYYAVANLESHSFSNVSPLAIAKIFVPDSYVSFEFALNYHGYFDQLPNKVTAVTPLKSKKYHFQNIEYQFVKAKPKMMTGYVEITVDGQKAKVATVEKIMFDFLQFRKDSYTVDLVLEKLNEARDVIDPEKMANYAKLYPITVQRRVGFLLDISGIDSLKIYENIKSTPGFAKLTKTSTKFNAKWRLYYEDRFVK